jgi:hypothetical protein
LEEEQVPAESQTDRLVRAFLDRSLPKPEWTHEAHLRVGLWHLLQYPPQEALDRLRDGIQQYNVACGVANTDSSGYHESITRFYVWVIDRFLVATDRSRPTDELADALVRECSDKELPLRYWSRDRLLSAEARLRWIEPDLQPLVQGLTHRFL